MAANVKENLLAFGLDVDFVTNNEQITKTRYVEIKSGQHLLRVDTDTELLPWRGHVPFPLTDYDAIVISDYNKVIVTKGGKGAMYKDILYATVKQDVVDVCGAGDTFLAALTYEFLNTNCIVQAIDFANKCSAITVGHRGVYALSYEDIQKVTSK